MVSSVTPFLMFEGDAEAALAFYISLFPGAEVREMTRYGAGEPGPEGTFKTAKLSIAGQTVMVFESPVKHAFGFTPAFSFFVECQSENEIDRLAAALAEGGAILMPLGEYGFSRRFTWVNDRYGVSWQLNLP